MYEPQTADLTRRGASPGTTAQALPLQVVTTSRPSRAQRSRTSWSGLASRVARCDRDEGGVTAPHAPSTRTATRTATTIRLNIELITARRHQQRQGSRDRPRTLSTRRPASSKLVA